MITVKKKNRNNRNGGLDLNDLRTRTPISNSHFPWATLWLRNHLPQVFTVTLTFDLFNPTSTATLLSKGKPRQRKFQVQISHQYRVWSRPFSLNSSRPLTSIPTLTHSFPKNHSPHFSLEVTREILNCMNEILRQKENPLKWRGGGCLLGHSYFVQQPPH